MRQSPLQNRVRPDAKIVATSQRGLFYGNRGGRFHNPKTKMLNEGRHWATKQWICCVLEFKNRQRDLMGPGYTELFFLDEVSALAAGHRPCFECRRYDAMEFAHAWTDDGERARAPEMDRVLHEQRLDGRQKRMDLVQWSNLPTASMAVWDDKLIAKSSKGALQWSFDGYKPLGVNAAPSASSQVNCLTPPAIREVLHQGYRPHWHPTAHME